MPSRWELDNVGPISDNTEVKVSIDLDITGSGGFGIAGSASALSLDVDQAAAQLTRSGTGWATPTVTYSFFTSSAQVSYNLDPGGLGNASIAAPSAALQANVSYAISLWDDIVATDFTEVAAGTGSINIGYAQDWATDSSGNAVPNYASAAYAWYPGTWGDQAGDVWINQFTMSGADWSNYYNGEWGIVTTVHEVGHAIGLSHPGDYNATPGQSITYSNSAAYIEDSMQYSIMSYFRATETGADLQPTIGRYQHPESPLLHDITAAQLIYGAEMSTRAGDTTYGFNSTAGRDLFDFNLNTDPALAIWDAGGIDTLDLSGYVSSVTIDLRSTYYSSTPGLSNNIAIAKNVVIENAVGTIAADLIIGNSSDNRIVGNGGGDTVDAGLGTDTYVAIGASSTYTSLSGDNVSAVLQREVNGRTEFTSLSNVEFVEFADQTLALGSGTSNSVSISDAILNEGDTGTSVMSFVVNLGSASGSDISVDYSVIGNSATNGIDFTAASTGTLVITAGATTGTIDIVVNGDTDFEADEQLTVMLTGSAGAVLGRATATGTIINDDAVVADDVGATVGTAEALPINSAFSREIEVTGDRDWFEVSLVNGQSYVFEARGSGYSTASATLADPYLRLLDSSGNELATNNDGLGGLSARIDLSNFALTSGNYYLEVSANNDAFSGTYQVAASSTSTVSTSVISVPTITAIYEGQAGNLSLTFDAPLPTAVEISLLAVAGSAIAADYIVPATISLAPGQSSATIPLTAFDDALAESDESFDITLSITSGSAFFDSPAGNVASISTSVTIVDNDYGADDYDATTASTTQLIAGERRGELEVDGDHDWFRIDVTDLNNAYLFEIDAAGGGGGSLDDGYLEIRDSNGDLVAVDDDSGADRDSQLTFVPTATGTFFIDVSAYNDESSGTYTVRATEIPIPLTDADARGVYPGTTVPSTFLSTQSLNFGTDTLDSWRLTVQTTGTLIVTANNLTFDADFAILDDTGARKTDEYAEGNNNEYLALSVTAGSQYFILGYPFSGSGYYTIGAMVIGTGENLVFTNGDRALTPGEQHLISETSSNTLLSGNNLDNKILANTGDDTIFGFAGIDAIRAGQGNDVIDGGEGSDSVYAGGGNDTIRVWDSNAGDIDEVRGDEGVDTLDFSQFNSALQINLRLARVSTRDTTDLYSGTWRDIAYVYSIENVVGSAFDDEVIGSGIDLTLSGGAGNDMLYGRGGNDIIDGGAGIDTVKYDYKIDEYSYSLNGNEIVITGANEGTDTVYDNVEFFEFSSGTVSHAYLLSGLTPLTFTSGVDVVDLSFLGGSVDALGGDDVLSYKGGTIDVDGNTGSDTLDFSGFGSAIEIDLTSSTGTNFRTQDTDNLRGTVWRDFGSSSNVENIIGTAFEDRIIGDSSNNTLTGGKGNDVLLGGLQPDAVFSPASNNGLLAAGNFGNSDIYTKQVGDFNGDGVDDLNYLYSGPLGMYQHTYLNNGNGTYTAAVGNGRMTAGNFGPTDIYEKQVGDFNGDGVDDLNYLYSGPLGMYQHTYLNNGDGTYAAAAGNGRMTAGNFGPTDIYDKQVGDFNGDGVDDLNYLYSGPLGMYQHTYLNNGNGTYAAAAGNGRMTAGNFGPTDIYEKQVGDFNGDGVDDLNYLYSGPLGMYQHTYLNNGDGTYAAAAGNGRMTAGNFGPTDIYDKQVGDFNGDGVDDLNYLYSGPLGLYQHTYLNNGNGTYSAAAGNGRLAAVNSGSTDFYEKQVGDFNGDGVDDLNYLYSSSFGLYQITYLNNGNGTYTAASSNGFLAHNSLNSQDIYERQVGDFNGDGADDLNYLYSGSLGLQQQTFTRIGSVSNDADVLSGGDGIDWLTAYAGDDRLIGGLGNDRMWGGAGSDTFVFDLGDGVDTIEDFTLNVDTLDLSSIAGVSSIGDLAFLQIGDTTVIDIAAGDQIRLSNVDFMLLDSDDFLF